MPDTIRSFLPRNNGRNKEPGGCFPPAFHQGCAAVQAVRQKPNALVHFLIETLCVSIVTLSTLRGKSAVFPLAYGAGVRSRVRRSDAIFNGISL